MRHLFRELGMENTFLEENDPLIYNRGRYVKTRKTCWCNEYPLKPHFYIKLGYAGVYLFILFLIHNIDCGYLLELPR